MARDSGRVPNAGSRDLGFPWPHSGGSHSLEARASAGLPGSWSQPYQMSPVSREGKSHSLPAPPILS